MAAASFQMEQFERKMGKVLERVRLVLDSNRLPCWAADVDHQYQDKYILAESMTNMAIASQVNALVAMGLSSDQLSQLCTWATTSAVSLQFRSEERCSFVREESREVESPTKHVEEVSVAGAVRAALTSKVVTTVTEYFWKYEVSYEVLAIRGVGQDADSQISIKKRTGQVELKTTSKSPPKPEAKVPAADIQVNVSWLVKSLNTESMEPCFRVDREHPDCHTPRRNRDATAALEHFNSFNQWAVRTSCYLQELLRVQPDPLKQLDLKAINVDNLLAPVLPLLDRSSADSSSVADQEPSSAAAASEATPTSTLVLSRVAGKGEPSMSALGVPDINRLLAEEAQGLLKKQTDLQASFPQDDTVATSVEAVLAVVLKHCSTVCLQWAEALDYIEGMIRKQLIAAIGKEVMPADFAEYMQFHNRKLFADAYAPTPFCFAVRRSDKHSPEGTVSIEQEITGGGGDSNIAAPIVTLVSHSDRPQHMQFPLSASTSVTFGGDKYLHAWLSHKFSGETGARLSLVSRARQFSSMIVLVGRISSARTFDPKYAAIVQNKDELKIPLDMSTIPTPKEFKDAIESLSPQQQAFAKAFRSMQLESTLFGILVIQIKPQLERVLNLPDDSLTKEIKLTQELMQLFIKYQIPSDLLAFDADMNGFEMASPAPSEKLEAVKAHVKAMNEMIDQSKQEEVEQRRMEYSYAQPQSFGGMDVDLGNDDSMECFAGGGSGKGGKGGAPRGGMMNAMRTSMAMGRRSAPQQQQCAAPPPMMACAAAPQPMMACAAGAAMPYAAPSPSPSSSAMPSPPPAPTQQVQQTPQQPPNQSDQPQDTATAVGRDYTQVPKEMDERFEKLDTDSQLRPTIISPSGSWTKRAQKALLASPTTTTLGKDEQKKEKDAAFDLLDALTKSGAVSVENASLHIVVAATHCFDKTVTETIVQDNVNPIDKVERSTLIMATTVHQQPASALIRDAHLARVTATSPALFLNDAPASLE